MQMFFYPDVYRIKPTSREATGYDTDVHEKVTSVPSAFTIQIKFLQTLLDRVYKYFISTHLVIYGSNDGRSYSHAHKKHTMKVLVQQKRLEGSCHEQEDGEQVAVPVRDSRIVGEADHQSAKGQTQKLILYTSSTVDPR